MNGYLKQILRGLRIAAGVTLILVGIIGLFVPVLQGVLLILAGCAVLELPWVKVLFLKIRKKFKRK
jgi:uncharacterized protein YqgC (DUF456 family)